MSQYLKIIPIVSVGMRIRSPLTTAGYLTQAEWQGMHTKSLGTLRT
jgi:hypothetical protein